MFRENTDTYAVLEHLTTHGSIDEYYALFYLGVKRLSARINDLKNAGYKIETKLKTVTKRNGRKTRVTERYLLA